MSRILRRFSRTHIRTFGFNQIRCAFSQLSPGEAGEKAESIASELFPDQKFGIGTHLAHAGIEDIPNAPMAPPLHVATTYTRPADGNYLDGDSIYSRNDNPTRLLLEKTMWELETMNLLIESDDEVQTNSFAFSSGMMAVTGILLTHKTPLTVILPEDLYHGCTTLLSEVFSRHGVEVAWADMSSVKSIHAVIQSTKIENDVIVWMESPSNPKCQVIDIKAVCDAIRKVSSHTITTVVDATMASPVVTRPLELGADIVMHSGTKYIAGHSDALLGILSASPVTSRGQAVAKSIRDTQIMTGGVASPWDSWLALRGLKTLHIRVKQQASTAQALAQFLESSDLVIAVHYPGLPSHPQHDVARRQMENFGGVLSFEFETEAMAMAFAGALKIVKRATSLGGTETLIEHRASIEPPERRTSPPGLLRVSVGLEDERQLLQDMKVALSIAEQVVLHQ